ncbi:MAG: hypothetical protein AB1333_00750 [Patescibacteria group bacterium]
MKRFSLLFVLVVALISFSTSTAQTHSKFIQKCIEKHAGFSWGVGLDKEMKEFEWFAFYNSDGYYQMELSRKLKPTEVEEISECVIEYSGSWIGIGGFDDWSKKGIIKTAKKYNKLLSDKVFKKLRVVEYF